MGPYPPEENTQNSVNAWRKKIWKFSRKFDPESSKIEGDVSPEVLRQKFSDRRKTSYKFL